MFHLYTVWVFKTDESERDKYARDWHYDKQLWCSGAPFLKLSSVEQFFTQLRIELLFAMRHTLNLVDFWLCWGRSQYTGFFFIKSDGIRISLSLSLPTHIYKLFTITYDWLSYIYVEQALYPMNTGVNFMKSARLSCKSTSARPVDYGESLIRGMGRVIRPSPEEVSSPGDVCIL